MKIGIRKSVEEPDSYSVYIICRKCGRLAKLLYKGYSGCDISIDDWEEIEKNCPHSDEESI